MYIEENVLDLLSILFKKLFDEGLKTITFNVGKRFYK